VNLHNNIQPEGQAAPVEARGVFAVTVTYGSRAALLSEMLASTLAQGVLDIVVVDNGALWDISKVVIEHPAARLRIVRMGRNTGSAAGFAAGIKEAMSAGASLLWLLDDDNRPLNGALSALLAAYDREIAQDASRCLALLAFRPEHQAEVASGAREHEVNPRNSSFLGFHVLDLPGKIWFRRPWRKPREPRQPDVAVRLDVAPYSGLLLHRSVVDAIGFPREDFVLYADDSEWTYRITRRGGQIILITAAQIEDMESSWNAKHRYKSAMRGLLTGGSDFRAYYGVRNAVNFQSSICRSRAIFRINATLYLLMLSIVARLSGCSDRYRLIKQASSDGLTGRLGQNEGFPL
jgi:GT2 family glycosyltransferase